MTETPTPTTTYLVAFDSDLTGTHRPGPAACSTPQIALGLVRSFGDPVRLYVRVGSTVARTYDLRRVALGEFADWEALIDHVRLLRKPGRRADA